MEKLRIFAAIMTGCTMEILAVAGLWAWTQIRLPELAFISVTVYLAAAAAVMWITEPKKEKTRKHTEPQIFNLKEEEHD